MTGRSIVTPVRSFSGILVAPAAQGTIGPPGPTGFTTGFGQIRYGESTTATPVIVPANVRTPLTFVVDPTQTQDFLNPPFAGVLNFDGTKITPRALDDAMFVLVNLLVTANVSGGATKVDIDVGAPAGPTGSDTEQLFNPAGESERVTHILYVQTLANFMANGARLYITASVQVSIINETIALIPQSTHSAG